LGGLLTFGYSFGYVGIWFFILGEFKEKLKTMSLLNTIFYAENYYGTEKKELETNLEKYDLVLTQIEVNGKHNFDKKNIPHLSIFLLPESIENLKKRVEKRGGISPELIENRMEIAKSEIEASSDYDYKIINTQGKLAETIEKISKL